MSSHVAEVVRARDPKVAALLSELTADLAGYAPEESFDYSSSSSRPRACTWSAVRVDRVLAGIGGVELQGHGGAELKRFYVVPEHRGAGVADAVITALLASAAEKAVATIQLETGDQQLAAVAFYRRHGFVVVPRFPPYLESVTSVCMQRPATPGPGAL